MSVNLENIVIQKYGGTSVANAERIAAAARRITEVCKAGNKVVVVLSAQGSTTDRLLEKAREVNPHASKRELDMLLSTGEQQSVALMAIAIHKLGFSAISLNAAQVGIETTDLYSNARITNIKTNRLLKELDRHDIVIVAGFQGVSHISYELDESDADQDSHTGCVLHEQDITRSHQHLHAFEPFTDITTIGRGGSDTTAVALAAVLHAKVCEICTDVDGIYTADPRIVPNAKKLSAIGYSDMLELTASGLQKPHHRAVEMAQKFNVKILVRSSMSDAPGTWIKEDSEVERLSVSGLAEDRNVARVTVMNIENNPGTPYKIFSLLAEEQISVDIILQSVGHGSTCDISFTVHKQDLHDTIRILDAHKEALGYNMLDTDENLAKLTVVGTGMATNFGVASDMFKALYECGVTIQMISTSEIKITVLIDERQLAAATKAIHDQFDI